MKNFSQTGKLVNLTAPYAVTSGAGFLVGSLFAVATNDAASGAAVVGLTRGILTLAKNSAEAWTVGVKLYWDNTAKVVTSTVGTNTLIGCAAAVAANPSATGSVRLNGTV